MTDRLNNADTLVQQVLEGSRRARSAPSAKAVSAVKEETADGEVMSAQRDVEIKQSITSNPVYGIVLDNQMSHDEKLAKLKTFFDYEKGADAEKMLAARNFLYFINMVRRELAIGKVKATADDIHSTYQQTIDSLFKDLGDFSDSLNPLREVYGLIEQFHQEELAGTAKPLVERITEALRQREAVQRQQALNLAKADEIERRAEKLAHGRLDDLRDELDENNAGFLAFTRKSRGKAIEAEIAKVEAEITKHRADAATLRKENTVEKTDKSYDPRLIRILDVSGQEFRENAHTAALRTISLINTSQQRMSEVINGYESIQNTVADLSVYASDIDMYVSTMATALEDSIESNRALLDATSKEAKLDAEEAKEASGTDELVRLEKEADVRRQQRYLSDLLSFNRSLKSTGAAVKETGVSLGMLEENVRHSIEQAQETNTNTIATVSESISTLLLTIIGESNANKMAMVQGVLSKLKAESDQAQEKQYSALPEMVGDDNRSIARRIQNVQRLTDVMGNTRDALIEEMSNSEALHQTLTDVLGGLQKVARETRDVLTAPADEWQAAKPQQPVPANDVAPTRPEGMPGASKVPAGMFPTPAGTAFKKSA